MNNKWNIFIYKWWAPVYDYVFNTGLFLRARKEIFDVVSPEQGSKVLVIGVGTGADLPYLLNKGYKITAIDYSTDMLKQSKKKFADPSITFREMDAQQLLFENETFDFIVANLTLTVVPDAKKTIKEMVRVLKKNGRFLVFDKFVPKNKKMSIGQKVLRPIIKVIGTDIGLDFYEVYKIVENACEIIEDKHVMMKGLYRKILVKRKDR
ncbi:class I SAM-dependent methyltransferase [Bacillus cihuensis]|uniref:class I SAM-dependent methyltransferase n=1 Tax=Bacillus cihuensis TaxID=1208599 RepID=UPI000407FD95|nr:class I SAM-dependent methyltransferase [Bacillus cihuensis]